MWSQQTTLRTITRVWFSIGLQGSFFGIFKSYKMLQVLKDLWSALPLSFQLQMVNNLDPGYPGLHRYRTRNTARVSENQRKTLNILQYPKYDIPVPKKWPRPPPSFVGSPWRCSSPVLQCLGASVLPSCLSHWQVLGCLTGPCRPLEPDQKLCDQWI